MMAAVCVSLNITWHFWQYSIIYCRTWVQC